MTRAHGQKTITTCIALLALSGCATIGTLTEPETKNKIFSGTIRHVELKCAHAVCLDMPFSLIADAVLLPVTIPWTAYDFIEPAENEKSPGRGGREK
jgi:uncharacterized protein YceK